VVVLHSLAPGAVGGLERVVQLLAAGQRLAGDDPHVAAVVNGAGDGHPFVTALRADGVPVHLVTVPLRGYRRERAELIRLCRELRADVLHTHGYRADVVDAAAGRSAGVPVVSTVHGFTGGGWRNRLYEWVQRRSLRRHDAVVAVSQRMEAALLRSGVPASSLHLVPNAWTPGDELLDRPAARRALGLPAEGFVAGWVGRVSFEKGPDLLIDAMLELRDVPLLVSVVGVGRERAVLEQRARQLGVGERLRWHGLVLGAGRLFRAFDVLLLTSRTEGVPIVLFEAMHAGTPIVATRVGGVPEMLSPGEALLVPAEDPVALAAALRAVRRDPEAAAARARRARARLERDFQLAPWVARYRNVYERAATRRVDGAR
jgi:glycosyltransferase involved in cell wall biosynthesis